eukprot:TRINITY_DN1672_c0_g1_i1.p2 TRINITY_DN1672_c0_g1~~TRINITY_DN1672_c0_g1_i1.p2  ORF type:complete len:147 (+),score=37.26 TRINITY_DN1672_c0_g1_i1:75-515(+)
MEPSTKSNPSIVVVGAPYVHPLVPEEQRDKVRLALEQLPELMSAAGVQYTLIYIQPEEGGLDEYIKRLDDRDQALDGVVVGYGVRGSNTLALTTLLENVINLTHAKRPATLVMFNNSPTSSLEAVARWFPAINYGAAQALMTPPHN